MPGTSTEHISRCLPEGGNCWLAGCWSLNETDAATLLWDGNRVLAGWLLALDVVTDSPGRGSPELIVDNGTAADNCDLLEWPRWWAATPSSRWPTDCVWYDGCQTQKHHKIQKPAISAELTAAAALIQTHLLWNSGSIFNTSHTTWLYTQWQFCKQD